jgi:hypothetical protein
MTRMKRSAQSGVAILCVVVSVVGVYNVVADNADVEHMAAGVACGGDASTCKAQKTMMERTPFSQTFEFATSKRQVGVRCTRAFVLVGDYTCAVR